jgi:antitoxin VapB
MHLNIKNDDAHELAKQLAAITGESLTAAVTEALRERLARLKRERSDKIARLTAIADSCARHLKAAGPMMEIDDLYDENGLPK